MLFLTGEGRETPVEATIVFPWRGMRRKSVLLLCGFLILGCSLAGCGKKAEKEQRSPHYRKAVQAYRQGDYARAVDLFQKALVFEPSNREIYLDIAAIQDDFLKNASAAISYYRKYLQGAPDGEKAEWVRRWIDDATVRLASSPEQADSHEAEADEEVDKEKVIESLREELRASNEALVEERKENTNLSDQLSTLNRELEATRKEKQTLEARLAARPARAATRRPSRPGRPVPVSWLLCIALGVLVMALILGQRSVRTREKALLASIQGTASGSAEDIRKENILGKYYWVENDRSAGTLSFTEKDSDIYACAIDGTTGLRSRGKGRLVGNVLTAELRSGSQEGVVTKFIFANQGRTLTAVWQGEEGTSVAAGTKAIKE